MNRQRGILFAPWMLYLVAGAAILAGLAWIVHSIESRGYDRGMAECARKAQEQRELEAKQAAGASNKLEGSNAKAKVVYRTITQTVDKIVDRPVYRNVCLDPDGLRGANAALRGPSATAGELGKPVPGPDPAAGRDRGIGAAEADRGG